MGQGLLQSIARCVMSSCKAAAEPWTAPSSRTSRPAVSAPAAAGLSSVVAAAARVFRDWRPPLRLACSKRTKGPGVGTPGGGSSGTSPSWAALAASQAETWAVSCNLHGRLGAMGHAASREPCNPTLLLSCALHAAAAGATRRVTVSRAPRCCWAAPASTRPPQRSASILPALASSRPRCPRNGGTLGSEAGHALPKMGGG